MSAISLLPSSRTFQVWEYQVSHGNLLIRSPQAAACKHSPEQVTNLDLHFFGVDYFELPRLLKGVDIVTPTEAELERLRHILEKQLSPLIVTVLLSGIHRFPIVAAAVKVTENQWDIFESPIEFRSQFRGPR
jgi:hypothetical protein